MTVKLVRILVFLKWAPMFNLPLFASATTVRPLLRLGLMDNLKWNSSAKNVLSGSGLGARVCHFGSMIRLLRIFFKSPDSPKDFDFFT